MSSSPPASALIRVERLPEYRETLRRHLPADLQGFVEFFGNPRRLEVAAELLRRHFHAPGGRVLNVGCGPLATEVLLGQLAGCRFNSFDYTPGFGNVYPALRERGLLPETQFSIADANTVELESEAFDLILMHDLFYELGLSLERLLPKYAGALKPGGLLLFDVMDLRARWLWRRLGKERAYRRYDIPAVLDLVRGRGFAVLATVPALGTHGRADRLFRRVLWHGLRVSNSSAILVRKTSR